MFITECPRDAMQGIPSYIPARVKADYINSLLRVGFHRIDFGSFVSPAAIPQLRDTAEVLDMLDLSPGHSQLLAIVGNTRGGTMAAGHDQISLLGYPWSISENFLRLNINSNTERSLQTIEKLKELCIRNNKELLVYITMAFGNPYGETWDEDILHSGIDRLASSGVKHISLSDTIGIASGRSIEKALKETVTRYPTIEFSLHLHSTIDNWYDKIDKAYLAGCSHFDGVHSGLGGCPMAGHQLVGNINTNLLVSYCEKNGISHGLDKQALDAANLKAAGTFSFTDT